MPATNVTAGRVSRERPVGYAPYRPQRKARELLAQVEQVLDLYRDHLPLTVRQVFYAMVGRFYYPKTEQAYDSLCEKLVRARRAQMIPFDVLRDDSVSVIESPAYSGLAAFDDETARRARNYQRDRQAGQPLRLELWCEAAGMMPQLAAVADSYSIPVYSASGFLGLSAVRQIADRALRSNRATLLLHVGDHDPSGVSIFDRIEREGRAFVRADRTVQTLDFRAERIALTVEQIETHRLPTAPAKHTDSRAASWQGGTCQCEALPPNLLAAIIETAIVKHLDMNVYRSTITVEQAERSELLGLPSGEQ